MNDDELGEFLRSEIPEPPANYWDEIDARIATAAAELPEVPNSEPVQTDSNVLRLTDMQPVLESPSVPTLEAPRRSWAPAAFAAAATVVVIAGLGFVLSRGDTPPTVTEPAATVPVETVPPVDDPSPDEELGGDDAEAAPLTTVTTPLPGVGEEALSTLDPFEVVVTGDLAISVNDVPGFNSATDQLSEVNETLAATGRRVLIDHREWLEVTRSAGFTGWVEALDVQLVGDEDTREGFELLPSVTAATLEVGRGGELEVLDAPGFDASQVASAEIGDQVAFTGNRALANGVEWFEVTPPDGETGWSMANTVQATGTITSSRLCYTDGENVLVLDFAADAETFTGAFAYLDSIEAVAGVRAGSVFLVAASPLGSSEEPDGPIVNEEGWTVFAEGMSIADRAFLDFVECTEVQSQVDQLDRIVGDSHPAIPFPD